MVVGPVNPRNQSGLYPRRVFQLGGVGHIGHQRGFNHVRQISDNQHAPRRLPAIGHRQLPVEKTHLVAVAVLLIVQVGTGMPATDVGFRGQHEHGVFQFHQTGISPIGHFGLAGKPPVGGMGIESLIPQHVFLHPSVGSLGHLVGGELVHDVLALGRFGKAVFDGHAVVIGPDGHVQLPAIGILERIDLLRRMVHAVAALARQHHIVVRHGLHLRHGLQFQAVGIVLAVGAQSQPYYGHHRRALIIDGKNRFACPAFGRQFHRQAQFTVGRNKFLRTLLARAGQGGQQKNPSVPK